MPRPPRRRLCTFCLLVALGGMRIGMGSAAVTTPDAPAPPGAPAGDEPAPEPPPLPVLYHADLDGRFAEPECAGIAISRRPPSRQRSDYPRLLQRLSAAREEARARGGTAPLILLGGNIAAPDLLGRSFLDGGAAGLDQLTSLLARGGYDAAALGHHDLSLPSATLLGLVSGLGARHIATVASNLVCQPARSRLCQAVRPQLLLRRGDTLIGLLATISPSVLAGLPEAARAGLTLDDPLRVVRDGVRRLRAGGATKVILMTQGPRDVHGWQEIDGLVRQLGSERQGPDLILAGGLAAGDEDSDSALRLLRREDAPPVVGSDEGARGLSEVMLPWPSLAARGADVSVAMWHPPPADHHESAAGGDALAQALLSSAVNQYCAQYQVPIGPAAIIAGGAGAGPAAISRDAFLAYTLQVMRRRAGAEVALLNRAAVKHLPFPLPTTGTITRGALHQALPYPATVGLVRITGATLEAVVGPALGNAKLAALGVARAGPDPSSPVRVNGRAIDRARTYTVATIAFVAAGGDEIVPAGALPWHALPGEPDLRQAVEESLAAAIDGTTDVAARPLLVGLTDVGLDFSDTRISNAAAYGDPQLTRADQRLWKGDATGIALWRHPLHEADSRLNLKYGWTRTRPLAGAVTSAETTDLITFSTVYNYRGLRAHAARPAPAIPDPYLRVGIESEFTRPEVTPTQTRSYHHLELTNSAGALFTLTPALKVRGGAGARKELLVDAGDLGRWRPLVEAGATLSPVALATVGVLAVRLEGLVDYAFIDPSAAREHQLRGNGKLSVPLLPLLFITAGVDLFAVQRQRQGWAAAYDTTVGLRLHLDAAHQWL